MEKSIFTPEHRIFVELLREVRHAAGVTQVQLARNLGTTQSVVSKWERGEARLDFVQVLAVCRALGTSLSSFAQDFERRTRGSRRRR
jgi:transcriptional regulator with XRE-family HTH domain